MGNERSIPDIRIFPNPANGQFTVILPAGIRTENMILCNIAGNVMQLPVSSNPVSFSTAGLKAGVYILQIPYQDGIITKKLLIY